MTISRTYRLQKSYCLFCSITSGPRSSGVWNPTQTWKALNNIELKIWVKKRLALSYHPWEKYFCLWYSCAFQMVGWWFQCTWISQCTQSNCLAKQNSSRKKKSILLPKHTVFVSLLKLDQNYCFSMGVIPSALQMLTTALILNKSGYLNPLSTDLATLCVLLIVTLCHSYIL